MVDGKQFPDKESCRAYAIARITKMVPLEGDFRWECQHRTLFKGLDPTDVLAHEVNGSTKQ